jgi:hypothetical protein
VFWYPEGHLSHDDDSSDECNTVLRDFSGIIALKTLRYDSFDMSFDGTAKAETTKGSAKKGPDSMINATTAHGASICVR